MSEFLWSLAVVASQWIGAIAGIAVADWRDKKAGREPDRGYWP